MSGWNAGRETLQALGLERFICYESVDLPASYVIYHKSHKSCSLFPITFLSITEQAGNHFQDFLLPRNGGAVGRPGEGPGKGEGVWCAMVEGGVTPGWFLFSRRNNRVRPGNCLSHKEK